MTNAATVLVRSNGASDRPAMPLQVSSNDLLERTPTLRQPADRDFVHLRSGVAGQLALTIRRSASTHAGNRSLDLRSKQGNDLVSAGRIGRRLMLVQLHQKV